MRRFRQRRTYHNWPKTRPLRGGNGYRVEGRCMTVEAWEAVQAVSITAVVSPSR